MRVDSSGRFIYDAVGSVGLLFCVGLGEPVMTYGLTVKQVAEYLQMSRDKV